MHLPLPPGEWFCWQLSGVGTSRQVNLVLPTSTPRHSGAAPVTPRAYDNDKEDYTTSAQVRRTPRQSAFNAGKPRCLPQSHLHRVRAPLHHALTVRGWVRACFPWGHLDSRCVLRFSTGVCAARELRA